MIVFYDENRKVKICDEPLKIMKKYIQNHKDDCEAGGIIIGRENLGNENLILEYITEPMKMDRRMPTRFYRQDCNHIKVIEQLHYDNNNIYAYYGEWHTHFEDIPHYSPMDLNNWKKISKNNPNKIQFYIIVGMKKIVIWKMKKGNIFPKKVHEVEWGEIVFKKD